MEGETISSTEKLRIKMLLDLHKQACLNGETLYNRTIDAVERLIARRNHLRKRILPYKQKYENEKSEEKFLSESMQSDTIRESASSATGQTNHKLGSAVAGCTAEHQNTHDTSLDIKNTISAGNSKPSSPLPLLNIDDVDTNELMKVKQECLSLSPTPSDYSDIFDDHLKNDVMNIPLQTAKNASKWCWSNGTWANYSDYSECKQLPTGVQYDLKSLEEGYRRSEIAAQLYLIGYGLSFAALIIAVVIYLYCRELRCLRNSIHTNLMFTYILADLLWMCLHVSQISLISNIQFCAVFFILYHYFQLTNYYWMFVEGLYLYLLVVRTFSGDTIKLRTCMLLGWGLPLGVVIAWVIARLVKTYEASGMEMMSDGRLIYNTRLEKLKYRQWLELCDPQEEMLSKHCPWMIPHPYDLLYEISAIFVLFVNVLFLFRIMCLITKLRSANNQEAQQYRKAAKALLVLIPLLGVTYILMMYGPTDGPIADWFNYIRAVMFSFQGLMVAVLYCFLNGEVRNALRHHYERWRTERSLGDRNRNSYAQYAQRDNTESVRLYTRPDANNTVNNYAKETTVSEPSPAVATALSTPNNNNNHHNNNHNNNSSSSSSSSSNNNNNNGNSNSIIQKFFAARSKTSHI